MTTITLLPIDPNEPETELAVPDGEEWYWSLRCRELLTRQLIAVSFEAHNANDLTWLGQITCDEKLATARLMSWHTNHRGGRS